MAYTVNIGVTSKKRNSTTTSYVTRVLGASCLLKKPTDITAPTFTYQGSFPEDANYFYVTEWDKYFWLTGAVFTEGHWEFSGKCDVLATYKNDIGSSTQYVARASSTYDGSIPDGLCQATGVSTASASPFQIGFSTVGTYIVGVAGSQGTMYYACNKANFNALYTGVFSNGFLENLIGQAATAIQNVNSQLTQTFGEVLYNSIINPGQYIQSAIWIPFAVTGTNERIYLGVTPTSAVGVPVNPSQIVAEYTNTIDLMASPWIHPQYSTIGSWTNSNIGRKLTISVPAIGDISIDLANNPATLSLHYTCDIFGSVTFMARHLGQCVFRTGSVAAQIGIADIRSNISAAMSSIASAAGGIVSGNAALTAHGLISGFQNMIANVDTISSGSSRSVASTQPVIQISAQFITFKDCYIARQGKPLCQATQINALSGYIECVNADVLCAALEEEKQAINALLNGGFYYE